MERTVGSAYHRCHFDGRTQLCEVLPKCTEDTECRTGSAQQTVGRQSDCTAGAAIDPDTGADSTGINRAGESECKTEGLPGEFVKHATGSGADCRERSDLQHHNGESRTELPVDTGVHRSYQ